MQLDHVVWRLQLLLCTIVRYMQHRLRNPSMQMPFVSAAICYEVDV